MTFLNEKEQALIDAINALAEEIKKLQTRIHLLEQRGWKGDYQRAQAYVAGAEVRYDDARWYCIESVGPNEVPGTNNKWQLTLKRGDLTGRKPTQARTLHTNAAYEPGTGART